MAAAHYSIKDFKHRVAVCSMKDVVNDAGEMRLTRKDVYHCWAKITVSVSSMFSKEGQAVRQGRNERTHKIVIRMRRDIDFTVAAWLYEERLQSPPRWFKVLSYQEQGEAGEFLELDCRLTERGMEAAAPAEESLPAAMPLPEGVQL